MSPIAASHHFAASRRWLHLTGLALVAVTLVATALTIWGRRQDVSAANQRDIDNLSVVLSEQAARLMQPVDLELQETQQEILATGLTSPAEFKAKAGSKELHRFLHFRAKNLPQMDVIGLSDADGILVNGSRSWPSPALDLAGRDWYIYLRDHDDPGLFISRPLRATVTGAWTFYLARRIDGPHGEFLGVVAAGIQSQYFEEFYKAITLRAGASVALYRRDGTLLARDPHAEQAMGRQIPAQAPLHRLIAQGADTSARGYVDGTAELLAVKRVRDFPLAVAVTIAEDAALADWRRQSVFIGLGGAAMAIGIAALFIAVTARSRRAEGYAAELAQTTEALRGSEARFRDFATSSSDWFWETDQNHCFRTGEGKPFLGQHPRAAVGKRRSEFAADTLSEQSKWQEHYAKLDRHEPFRDFIYAGKVGDHPVRMISVSGTPLFDEQQRFIGYRGASRDVTEQVFAERRLLEAKAAAEAANLAKSQFLANVSHELRTPLNAILGYSEMLELGIGGKLPRRQVERIGIIRQSGRHLLGIINDILDLAKIDAGHFALHDEHGVEPARVIDACVALVRQRARECSLRLTVEIEALIPALVVDSTRLKQVLLNLLSNAVKFTPPGGSVVLTCRGTADGGLAFVVSDTGLGMTEAEIGIALEPFGQVDAGLERRYEGTGLGLPLARRLIELHGGSLSISSEKGQGTTVTATLPASRVLSKATPRPAAAAAD